MCLKYSRKTLKTFKSIADRTADLRESTPCGDDVPYNHFKQTAEMVSPDTRLPKLSYSHHREISPLPPEQQKEFLQKASDEKLPNGKLRSVTNTGLPAFMEHSPKLGRPP